MALVVVFIGFATFDLVTSAAAKDQQVQESELKGQLAQFLLTVREPDGSTLLENPAEFSAASRPASPVALRRFPFTYLLNSSNARNFKTTEISWEAPRACQTEFTGGTASRTGLRACFAVTPGDPTGRYIYFSLRYPAGKVNRHVQGRPLNEADRVELSFNATRKVVLTLVYEVPPLVAARYPSFVSRFDGVHELTSYLGSESGRPTSLVNGQAFESDLAEPDASSEHFVTMVGRIDSAMLFPEISEKGAWPAPQVRAMRVGMRVFARTDEELPSKHFDIPADTMGTPLVSLSQAYLAAVPSRARLEVTTPVGDSLETLWRSDDAGLTNLPRMRGPLQGAADWWAGMVLSSLESGSVSLQARQQLSVAGLRVATATLTAAPLAIPDIAARAFTWLSVAALLILLFAVDLGVYLFRLLRLRGTAYSMTVSPMSEGNLTRFIGREREIGTLARIFNLLIKRSRTKSANAMKRSHREASLLRIEEAHVQNRQAILEAIGHEIRSPLQSLQTLLGPEKEVAENFATAISGASNREARKYLERIRRAVEALYDATSVEAGLRAGEIVTAPHDLAVFARTYAQNLSDKGSPIRYIGPASGVIVSLDNIQLEQILDNLIENALRYSVGGTNIELRLVGITHGPALTVFNQGQRIPEDELERIFGLGVSDRDAPANAGLGLFASRIYALAMGVTLRATNEEEGVAFTLQFPWPTSAEGS